MNNLGELFANAPRSTMGAVGAFGGMTMDAQAINSNMAFLVGELEKLDPKLYEPLSSVTWARDIVVRTGGGFADSVSAIDVNYSVPGGPASGLIAGATNNIPVIKAAFNKENWRLYTWANVLEIGYIDQEKMKQVVRNLEDALNKGLKLNHDKTLDMNVYTGFESVGSTGLVNNPDITRISAPNGVSGTSTWDTLTADEILDIINYAINFTWEQSEGDLSGMANHILIPHEHYASIVSRKVGVTGDKSILTYLEENNIGAKQGNPLHIAPSLWCKGAGSGGTNRMVVYANREDRVHFENTVPLQRVVTQMDAARMAYLTPFVSQFSEVKFLYKESALYVDGI